MTPHTSRACLLGKDAPLYPSTAYSNSIPTSLSHASTSSTALSVQHTTSLSLQASTANTSSPTFPLFTLLPPELRLKIWSLTLPPPRLIPLSYGSSLSPVRSHRGCTSNATLPITLHINHESRALALQHYSLSFGLSGGISYPGARATTLPCKIYFSPSRGDVLFFGVEGGSGQEAMARFVNACLLVHPGSSGFGSVKRLAVQKALFTGSAGKGVTEMNLWKFWERVRSKFTALEEVVFVERGEDALVYFEGGREGAWEGEEMRGNCYADDGVGIGCWEEERLQEKIERVVRGLESEKWWTAPRWEVLGHRLESLDVRMEGLVIDMQAKKAREKALVAQMREIFGHEDVSNAF